MSSRGRTRDFPVCFSRGSLFYFLLVLGLFVPLWNRTRATPGGRWTDDGERRYPFSHRFLPNHREMVKYVRSVTCEDVNISYVRKP